ncbi:MAG: adenine phosphoribosyltransferase [Longimicrobiales bacterium]
MADRLRAAVRDVPDFPRPGVLFKDITPVLADSMLFAAAIDALADTAADVTPDIVVGIESRGFIIGAPVALRLGLGFVPIRKPGKLPFTAMREAYALEYGEDFLEAHVDAIASSHRVLIVDDVLATGGTAEAAARLIERLGGAVAGFAFLLELGFLNGRQRLTGRSVRSLLVYD